MDNGRNGLRVQRLPMEQPLAVTAENSRAKVQNVGGDSSDFLRITLPVLLEKGNVGAINYRARRHKSMKVRREICICVERSPLCFRCNLYN